jgi:hypothetical protein
VVAERGEEAGLRRKKSRGRKKSGGNATQLADHSPAAGGVGARRLRWPLPCRLQKTEGRSGSGRRDAGRRIGGLHVFSTIIPARSSSENRVHVGPIFRPSDPRSDGQDCFRRILPRTACQSSSKFSRLLLCPLASPQELSQQIYCPASASPF